MGDALTNGVTPAELAEVVTQDAVDCGAPAALDGVRLAKETFAEVGCG
jgi:4-carboxymuconolactone decarboxylase